MWLMWILIANLVIGRQREWFPITTQDSSWIPTISDNDFVRRYNCNNSSGSNSITFWSLHLTLAIRPNLHPLIPRYYFLVHPPKASFHCAFPPLLDPPKLLFHQLMQSLLTLYCHLHKDTERQKLKWVHISFDCPKKRKPN